MSRVQNSSRSLKEEFLYVLEKLLVTPDTLCGLFINECGDPKNPFNANWEIDLPEKSDSRQASRLISSNKIGRGEAKTMKVLQLSDLHFDLLYEPGTESKCTDPICCHRKSKPKSGKKIKKPAGYWGTLGDCDLPIWTIEAMFEDIVKTHPDIDYVMLAGDYMAHNDWDYTKEGHLGVLKNLSAIIKNYFPTTPVFYAIGNHEGVPVNSFAPHNVPEKYRPQWIYNAIKEAGEEWLPRETYKDIEYRGSWSVMVEDNLRLITINTGYCETTNFWLYLNQTDPDGSLSWLVKELFDAENKGNYVHILGHVPPGDAECLEGWARNYYRIINRFKSIVTGQFFAHVHTDSFTVFYEDMNDITTEPTNVLYVAPSVTTYSFLNPAYRIYEIEKFGGYRVIDHQTYVFNLSKPESKDNLTKPHFELLYSAKDAYQMNDMSPVSWNNLINQIETDPVMFDKFLDNYSRNLKFKCNDSCKKEMVCSLHRAHHNDTKLCHRQLSSGELVAKEGISSITYTKEIVNNIEPSIVDRIISSETFDNVKNKLFSFFG
uniref:Sphingomyelin phosphodiesterase n=1 Tax=Rhabditophanes sp. KR3021 TaxID=114890 RepID=A0AC35U4T5_9BILA